MKIVYNSNELKNIWEKRIFDIQTTYLKAEYESITRGMRQAGTFSMSPKNFDVQIDTITRNGLIFLPICRTKSQNNFEHIQNITDIMTIDGIVHGVIAKDINIAQKYITATHDKSIMTQGEILNYPKCCIKNFAKLWKNQIYDPIYEITNNTNKCDFKLNLLLRYYGIRVIPFFPCNLECKESLKIADEWFNLLKTLNSDVAEWTKELLSMNVEWSLNKGLIYIKHPIFKIIANGYNCDEVKEIKLVYT